MGVPIFKMPQGVPSLLKQAANDDSDKTARELAKKRWGGQVAKKVVKSGVAVAGVEAGMIAVAVPAFLGTMGLAAYAYLSNRTYYDAKRFAPCGTEPRLPTPHNRALATTPDFSKLTPGNSFRTHMALDPETRDAWRAYIQSSGRLPAIDKPQDKTVPQWLDEMAEGVRIAIAIADKQIEIYRHNQNGDSHLARRAEQELNVLQAQAETIVYATTPVGRGLQVFASANGGDVPKESGKGQPDKNERGADPAALADQYLAPKLLEDVAYDVAKARTLAAFSEGAVLTALRPIEIYDPIADRVVRIPSETPLEVAGDEGNVIIGRLTDNSHSLGVLYEEPQRWYRRKYFLPLSTLVDHDLVRVENGDAGIVSGAKKKGLGLTGEDARTAVVIRDIQSMTLRDELSYIPRGARITVRRSVEAVDVGTGQKVLLPANTTMEVVNAVGSVDAITCDDSKIDVKVDGRALQLPMEVLADLDPHHDVQTLEELEKLARVAMDRRQMLFRTAAAVTGLGFLGLDFWLHGRLSSPEVMATGEDSLGGEIQSAGSEGMAPERRNHILFSTVYSEIAALYGFLSARDQYWWQLHGAIMNLKQHQSQTVMNDLSQVTGGIRDQSTAFYRAWEAAFYNTVHSGWSEIKHYRTDDKGNRHYTHSTWAKTYSTVWTEPDGLEGFHSTLHAWMTADQRLASGSKYLSSHGLFDLLAADPDDAEKTFNMSKVSLGVGRDAAIAAITMALMTLPAGFYDELAGRVENGRWTGPERTDFSPERGYFAHQKEALTGAGMISGMILSHRSAKKQEAQLAKNKYDLGTTLESQIRRVPGLDFDSAWQEFFKLSVPEQLSSAMDGRSGELRGRKKKVRDFTYTYGIGWDNGHLLDPYYVDSTPVGVVIDDHIAAWPSHATELSAWAAVASHKVRALPVLQNGIGTKIVEAQMREDKGEAASGSLKRSTAFGLPVWGFVLADMILKKTK